MRRVMTYPRRRDRGASMRFSRSRLPCCVAAVELEGDLEAALLELVEGF